MTLLVTGAAGFIGMYVCQRLLERGDQVAGLDNLNDYYDVSLKMARLARLSAHRGFQFAHADIADREALASAFNTFKPERVIHLAAQVGVRNSLKNPAAYIATNVVGFGNVLEECRKHGIDHLVYASSSSVYGGNTRLPFSEADNVDHPLSLYAATKKSNELMAHSYSHLWGIPTTGVRFFTVYGPWGRPDMAPLLFAKSIMEGRAVDVFNNGDMLRDFTYIDDVAEGVLRLCDKAPGPDPSYDPSQPHAGTSKAPFRIFNLGNADPVPLVDFIAALESALARPVRKNYLPIQPGDVPVTAANMDALDAWIGFRPRTALGEGIARLAQWYLAYYPPRH